MVEECKAEMISLGFPQFTIDDFHDVVIFVQLIVTKEVISLLYRRCDLATTL